MFFHSLIQIRTLMVTHKACPLDTTQVQFLAQGHFDFWIIVPPLHFAYKCSLQTTTLKIIMLHAFVTQTSNKMDSRSHLQELWVRPLLPMLSCVIHTHQPIFALIVSPATL